MTLAVAAPLAIARVAHPNSRNYRAGHRPARINSFSAGETLPDTGQSRRLDTVDSCARARGIRAKVVNAHVSTSASCAGTQPTLFKPADENRIGWGELPQRVRTFIDIDTGGALIVVVFDVDEVQLAA